MKTVKGYLENLLDNLNSDWFDDRVYTGCSFFDGLIENMNRAELVTIAGRPKMGKTCLLKRLVLHLLFNERQKIVFFSLEKSGKYLIIDLISDLTGLTVKHILSNDLNSHEKNELHSAIQLLAKTGLDIDDSPGITHQRIMKRIKKLSESNFKPDLIIIDYLQLMTCETAELYPRAAQLSEITRALKKIARENGVTIIITSQLNRDCEYRPNKRPQPIDLLDSGSIENDSDLVIFLYREEVYWADTPDKGLIEVNISKNRHGRTGQFKIEYPFLESRL